MAPPPEPDPLLSKDVSETSAVAPVPYTAPPCWLASLAVNTDSVRTTLDAVAKMAPP